jgi:hypothetical protein
MRGRNVLERNEIGLKINEGSEPGTILGGWREESKLRARRDALVL